MGAPGCPELAACTASIASVRIVLTHRASRSVRSCIGLVPWNGGYRGHPSPAVGAPILRAKWPSVAGEQRTRQSSFFPLPRHSRGPRGAGVVSSQLGHLAAPRSGRFGGFVPEALVCVRAVDRGTPVASGLVPAWKGG